MVKKAVREYPSGTDVISLLISEKINGDTEMEDDDKESSLDTESEIQSFEHFHNLGVVHQNNFQQPQSEMIASVRNNLSNIARMEIPRF